MGVGVAGILPPNPVGLLMYVSGAMLDAASAGAALPIAACGGSLDWFALCGLALTISPSMSLRLFTPHPEGHPVPRRAAYSQCLRRTVGVLVPFLLDVLIGIWCWTP